MGVSSAGSSGRASLFTLIGLVENNPWRVDDLLV